MTREQVWPALPLEAWRDTCETLQLWTQIVGKVRLAQTPWTNHSWHVPLYLTARGLTTSVIPHGATAFEMAFDFIDHGLRIDTIAGERRVVALRPKTVARFHHEVMAALSELGVPVHIHGSPNEIEKPIPFAHDEIHRSYDPEYVTRFFHVLVQSQRVLQQFRAHFRGKSSPIHFFWGSFDLALTRFSGRTAPKHPGGVPNVPDWVVREAYSHEVSSVGFWPGGGPHAFALFYSYAYPEPQGFASARVEPGQAFYSGALREYILPYDALRASADPDQVLLEFAHTTYLAAADLGRWDRAALECDLPDRAT